MAVPAHPGSQMSTEVLRRALQMIVMNCDRFSNFATATFISSESREDLVRAILAVVTSIRYSARVEVRTDRATVLKSLVERPDRQLMKNGTNLVLGDNSNLYLNCHVDKTIQELKAKLKRLSPEGGKIDSSILSQAVNSLNNRVQEHRLLASPIHFARDHHLGTNQHINWDRPRRARWRPGTPPPPSQRRAAGGACKTQPASS